MSALSWSISGRNRQDDQTVRRRSGLHVSQQQRGGPHPPRSRMTTPPATRRATTTISTSTFGGHGTTLGYDTEALSIAVGISSELAYDEPADDAATEEDESARKGDWYVNGDIDVDIGPATVDLQVVQAIKGDDSDPTVGPVTGFAAKITANLGDLSLSAGGDIVLTGATDTTPASTDYELGAGLGFALTDTTTMDADYIYSTDKDVASDVEVSLKDTAGIIENLSLALSWGLYDLTNGNPANESPSRQRG